MRILMTGAFGRLGQASLLEATRQGYQVSTFDVPSKPNRRAARKFLGSRAADPSGHRAYWGDIRRIDDLKPALEGVNCVIHYAAVLPPVTEAAPELAEAINVAGTRNLIQAVASTGRAIAIHYPSSLTVFGIKQELPPPRRIDEPTQASDNYTDHKLRCEQALLESGLPTVILRVAVSVGVALQGIDKQTLGSMLGVKADNRLEYIHPDDVATAMVNAVGNEQALGKILLVGGGASCQVTQRDLINATLGSAGLEFADDELGSNAYYTDWLDTEASQRILQYQKTSFAEFQQQMRHKLRFVRPFVKPLAPVIKPLLKRWLAS
jgi:nucleoside-diphosphate-sugar epimerase